MSTLMTMAQAFFHVGIVATLVQGGPVMIPLLASSVISLAVIIERGFFWRRLRQRAIDTTVLQCVAAGDLEQALQMAHASPHPVGRVLHAGLAYQHLSPGLAMAAAAQTELRRIKA